MAHDYDLISIGAGNAGIAAANAAIGAGWKVAIIEGREVGGTCPLRGCVPKKVLVAAAETLASIASASEHEITVGEASLDWRALIARKQTFVEGVPESFEASLTNRGVDVIKGKARFTGRNEIEVAGKRLSARKLVVATGSKPRPLPFDHLLTSDEFLDMDEQPGSMLFVGGGVIALEFAHVLARAGTKVTIVELMERPLLNFDPDAVGALLEHTRSLGVDILTSATTKSVEASGDRFTVTVEHDGETKTFEVDRVMNGAGRIAATDDLDLEAAGIDHDRGRIEVDDQLRSASNPDVYVAGDAIAGRPQLSPVATYEGRIVGHNLIEPDNPRSPAYGSMPSAVYTVPNLAQVGYSVAQAEAEGLEVDIRTNDMREWRSARTYAEPVAYAKVLIDRAADRIVGAHLLGHGAAETVHTFAMAIEHGIAASTLKNTVYAYPTFSSDIKYLL